MRTQVKPISFAHTLAKLIKENIQREIKSIVYKNYLLEVYIGQEKYIVYFADGLYYANDKDIAGEFDYYAGNRVITTKQTNEPVYEFHPENPKVNWELVRITEGLLRLAYIQASNTLRRGKSICLKGIVPGQSYYITKQGIECINEILATHLRKIFQVANQHPDRAEYDIHTYPDYSDDNGTRVITYIQIGYPDREDYPLNCDNLSFFLTINFITGECFIGTDFPWVKKSANLFDPRPQDGEKDWFSIDVWTAIQIFVSDAMRHIAEIRLADQLFTHSLINMGLKSNLKKADAFALKLLDKLRLEFSVKGTTQPTIKYIPYSNGITRFYAGILVMDIAIDTCGLVDIGMLENMTKTDTWESIWRVMDFQPDAEDNIYHPIDSYEKIIPYQKLTTESRVVAEEAAKIVQSLMYQIDDIVDIINEEVLK